MPWVVSLERLKTRPALLVIALLVERAPVVPPEPIWRMPVLMVVVPE